MVSGNEKRSLRSHRRQFIKGAGTIGILGLSGCTGGGNSEGGSGQFSDVTFEYWDTNNVNTAAAKENIQKKIKEFEQDTGATIKTNLTSHGELLTPKWPQAFNQGQGPHLYTVDQLLTGRVQSTGLVKPASEWMPEVLTDEAQSNLAWLNDIHKKAAGVGSKNGFPHTFEVPFAYTPGALYTGRMDHFEKAGVSAEDNWPPQNYDHLIEVATALDNDQHEGFQVLGDTWDWGIGMMWTLADHGADGKMVNEKWTDVQFQNDAWMDWAQKWHDTYNNHDLGTPGTPTMSDEKVSQLVPSGQLSIGFPGMKNHPTIMEQGGEMMQNGTMQYGRPWTGDANEPGYILTYGVGILKKPDGVDQDQWDRELEAVYEFLRRTYFNKEWQRNFPQELGLMPGRKDVWDSVKPPGESGHHLWRESRKVGETAKRGFSVHPSGVLTSFSEGAPYIQQMLKGDIGPEEAMNQVASTVRENVEFKSYSNL